MKRILTFVLFLQLFVEAYPIYFRHIGMQEGLSQLSVMAIYQDDLGRMWFGTEEGLNIYDGVKTISYKSSDYRTSGNFIIGNKIHYIVGDKEGNVYFNSDNSLMFYDICSQRFSCLRTGQVFALASHDGELWAGISDSICTLEPRTGRAHFKFKLPTTIRFASSILIDKRSRCWVGTIDGLYIKEEHKPLVCLIPNAQVYQIFEDSQHNIWISTRTDGIYKYSQDGHSTHFTSQSQGTNQLLDRQTRGFAEDNYGNIWIGTFHGLNRYNPNNETFTAYTHSNAPGSLSHNSVFPIYKDRQGSIWLGTYFGGVNFFNPESDLFTLYSADNMRADCLSYPFVGHMTEDKDNNVWICTEGGGLNFFDRKTKKFTHYMTNQGKNSIAHNNLKDIVYDRKREKLYIGTHTGGISIYNIRTKKFNNPYLSHPELSSRVGDRIAQMELWNDSLVFSTEKGIRIMNVNTEEFSSFFSSQKYYGNTCFLKDSKGYMWVVSSTGVYRINLKNEADSRHYNYNETGLGHSAIAKMIEDRKGRIFLGTSGSGLFYFDEKNDCFKGYNTENSGIAGNYCYELELFVQGQLIISGDKGLSFFDPERQLFKIVELGSALPLTGVNMGCGLLVCPNGEIFVGGTNGLASFFEQQLLAPEKEYQLYFSDLYINNEIVRPNDSTEVLSVGMPYTHNIRLNHDQNNLTIRFAINDYISPLQKPVYEYKLEGFDEKWIMTYANSISYTNIGPGKYTLLVREWQHNNRKTHTIAMQIEVYPPFYATSLFYFLYIVIIIGIIYAIFRFQRSKLLLKTSLEIEKKEKEKDSELNQAKLQFFANISHEFRTPLTLIISQIEIMLQSSSLSPMVYNKLLKVYKNAHHMRSLISELLNFRKLEQGHVKLKVSEQNITLFLKEIFLSFYEYANKHSIHYHFHPSQEVIMCWFDPLQLEKIVYNLLTNAFKYVEPGATIELHVEEMDEEIVFRIIDNGIGIKREDVDKIFNRFYQVESGSSGVTSMPSTGIGLSLVKGLVELHHGNIRVESTLGYGSIFIVSLQKGNNHFTQEECMLTEQDARKVSVNDNAILDLQIEYDEISEEQTVEEPSRTILLIEDNEELLLILQSLFAPTYKVLLARNGKEGLDIVRQAMPDIVVSDVMMPEMSGIEMCVKIKNDFNICHIPVVLLTALNSMEHNLEGLRIGADDYISKPFNTQILVSRCNNLLRNRLILKSKLEKHENFDTQLLATNPIDQKLLAQINAIIDKHLDNPSFDINLLANELNLSRSSLYNKFKALTGVTPNDFVLSYKLKQAAMMLRNNPELQISDITYKLGFNTPRYFSQCFKAQFGVIPTEYRKNQSGSI